MGRLPDTCISIWREYSCSKESVITMGPRAESWMYRGKNIQWILTEIVAWQRATNDQSDVP